MADNNKDRLVTHEEFEEMLAKGIAKLDLNEANAPLDAAGFAQELSAVIDNANSDAAQSQDRLQQLMGRLDKNLEDFHKEILALEKSSIISLAGEIAAMTDTHYYLTEYHDFEPEQIKYLLRFEKPLEVVSEKWQQRTEEISDICFALDEVFDKQDALWDHALYVETGDNGTYLQKFENVNILKTLKAIADKTIVHYPNDIKTDMDIIPKLAATGDPEKRMLLWHVSDYGTHINPERDTFFTDSGAYGTWTNYLRPGMMSYAIEVTGTDNGIISGNIYQLNHEAHVAYVKGNALPAHLVTIRYENGREKTVTHQHYDDERNKLMVENGNVTSLRFQPQNEKELAVILKCQQKQREQAPIGNIREHIKALLDNHAQKPSIHKRLADASKKSAKPSKSAHEKIAKKDDVFL